MLQETKLKKKLQVRLSEYEVFEKIRKTRDGGGLMIGIKKDIEATPVDVSPSDTDVEILVIELELKT